MKQIVIALLMLAALTGPTLVFAQAMLSTDSPPNGGQNLKMTSIGEKLMFGRRAAFRTYETPDHTEALVWYGEFRSEEESKLATELLLKDHRRTSTEQVKDLNGDVVGERIVATPKEEKKAFVVIQKYGSNYWIIQSISLAVAVQVDELIKPPTRLAAFAESSPSCDRSGELLSEQQRLSEERQKKVHHVRGMVSIVINADGDVVGAKVISVNLLRDSNEVGLSSAEAIDALRSQARSMKFKGRAGCVDFRYIVTF